MVRDAKLETKTARDKLRAQPKPYFKTLVPGELCLSYRRRLKNLPGKWGVRKYLGVDHTGVGRYRSHDFPHTVADDFQDADGKRVLSYAQAQARALAWKPGGSGESDTTPTGPATVAGAIDAYLAHLELQGRPISDAKGRARLHILPALGPLEVASLETRELRTWLANLAKSPRRGKGAGKQSRAPETDDEIQRRRRATANRTLTILKAALNFAFDEGLVSTNAAWGRRLKPFRNVEVARLRYLTVDEAKRLLNSCDPDFRSLVMAALATGARYGELTRLTVADFSVGAQRQQDGSEVEVGTIAIRKSKSGKARYVILTDEGVKFFRRLTAGRPGDEILLRKSDGTAWMRSGQRRPMLEAVERARITPAVSFHSLRHSYASLSIMAGVPLMVVAKTLGHVDTKMAERHYGHLSPNFISDSIRAGAPRFGALKATNVLPMKR
jgi:integrase